MALESENTLPGPLWFLFAVSFVEGGALMAAELVGAKLLAPFYGNSLYVWAAVLGLTLGGLAVGYFAGGVLSRRYPCKRTLYAVLSASALLVALMPGTGAVVMQATLDWNLRVGVMTSCLVVLFPPLVCFGMVSPLIIRLASHQDRKAGHVAGMVYAVSTIGGILTTYVVAFYAIAAVGLRETLFVAAVCLALLPVLHFSGIEKRLTGW